jgi:hypothetical protein
LATFHRSYALQSQGECNQQDLDDFYQENSQKIRQRYQRKQQQNDDSDEYNNGNNDEEEWELENFDGNFQSDERRSVNNNNDYGCDDDDDNCNSFNNNNQKNGKNEKNGRKQGKKICKFCLFGIDFDPGPVYNYSLEPILIKSRLLAIKIY